MTIAEYYDSHTPDGSGYVYLVDWRPEGNYLAIASMPDGRLDLVDCNCSDTGTDASSHDVRGTVSEWLQCLEADPDDVQDALGALDG